MTTEKAHIPVWLIAILVATLSSLLGAGSVGLVAYGKVTTDVDNLKKEIAPVQILTVAVGRLEEKVGNLEKGQDKIQEGIDALIKRER